jgi:hypothetical protein
MQKAKEAEKDKEQLKIKYNTLFEKIHNDRIISVRE